MLYSIHDILDDSTHKDAMRIASHLETVEDIDNPVHQELLKKLSDPL